LKVERVSAPFLTPSAARGILESTLWKPALVWRIERIALLREPKWIQFRRNEVNEKLSVSNVQRARKTGLPLEYFADEDRSQRNTLALRDVDYTVQAFFEATSRWGPNDSIRKFEEMFERRIERGQWVTPPVLGCREFPAQVEWYTGDPQPIAHDEDFGWILQDIRYGATNEPVFFRAVCRNGIIDVPVWQDRAGAY
jgi:CRISPR-associated protein Cas5d